MAPISPGQIRSFRLALLSWYDRHRRDLPWRHDRDPYRIWISEIMLQQTRVAAVLDHYARFLQRFPTVQVLAAARESSDSAAIQASASPEQAGDAFASSIFRSAK